MFELVADDFALRFLAATPSGASGDTGPKVFPYRFQDVVRSLDETQSYDWSAFGTTSLDELNPDPPTAGLEAAGYIYTVGEEMVASEAAFVKGSHSAELFRSLGFFADGDGTLEDV